jgi:hypothetical protein
MKGGVPPSQEASQEAPQGNTQLQKTPKGEEPSSQQLLNSSVTQTSSVAPLSSEQVSQQKGDAQPNDKRPPLVKLFEKSLFYSIEEPFSLIEHDVLQEELSVTLPDTDTSVYALSRPHTQDDSFSNKSMSSSSSSSVAVVPVSKLMTQKYLGLDYDRWDEFGGVKKETLELESQEAYWLASNKRYDNKPLVSRKFVLVFFFESFETFFTHSSQLPSTIALFGKKDDKVISEPLPLKKTKSTTLFETNLPPPKKEPSWNADEDDALFSLAANYQYNWTLVASVLESLHLSATHRSDWDCFKRFTTLSGKGFKPQMELDAFALPVKSSKNKAFLSQRSDLERSRLAYFFSRFDIIKKGYRKRDSQKPNCTLSFLYAIEFSLSNAPPRTNSGKTECE